MTKKFVISAEKVTASLKHSIKHNLIKKYSFPEKYLDHLAFDFPWNLTAANRTIEVIESNPKLLSVWEEATEIIGFDVLNYYKDFFDQEEENNIIEDWEKYI